jgi:large subunit ribosomal protein L28
MAGESLSALCQLTGRAPSFGKSVSHSHRRTSRRFDPNIQAGRY